MLPHFLVLLFRTSPAGSDVDAGHSSTSDVDSTHHREEAQEGAEQEKEGDDVVMIDMDSDNDTWTNDASMFNAFSSS